MKHVTFIMLALNSMIGQSSLSKAAILYESGSLGPIGVSWTELNDKTVPGTNISSFTYNGVRFELDQPVQTTEIGGHFVAPVSGTFFGVIVKLENADDFPDSADFSTPDVQGHTLLSFPTSSAEIFGNLNLSLDPGWYALLFGSGLFGATTDGGAVRNGSDFGNPSYLGFQPGAGWFDLAALPDNFENHRFVVKGSVVPEPSSIALAAVLITICGLRGR